MSAQRTAVFALCVLVFGCGGEAIIPDTDAPRAEAPSPTSLRPDLNIETAAAEELAVYFPGYAVDLLTEFQRRFVAVQTEADLARMYDAALGLDQRTLGEIDLMPFLESELPVAGLTPACVAECTEPAWLLDMADWMAAARHIDSPHAIAFFDALSTLFPYPSLYDGRIAAYPSHFERTWDYGGYSLLGSGRHTSLLRAFTRVSPDSAASAPTNPGGTEPVPFARLAQEFTRSILTDARVQSCIGPSAADARAELLSLAGTPNSAPNTNLTEEDRTRLLERAEALRNPTAHDIQTSCAPGSPSSTPCTCMGG